MGDSGIITVDICGPGHPYTGIGTYVLPVGNHVITIQGADGCVFTDTFNIAAMNGISIGVTMLTPVLCNGDTANLSVTATGGVAPYAGIGNFDFTAGTYTLTVSDNNGCADDTVINIIQPAPLIISDSVLQAIHCFGDTAQIQVNATGGIAPYTGTGQFQFSAGSYVLTVTDANNCVKDTSITFTQPSLLTIADSIIQSIHCFGDTAIIEVNGTGGTMPYTGVGQFPFTAGNYTLSISDANNCNANINVNVISPSTLTHTVMAWPDNGTGNGSAKCNVSGGTPPYNFLWSNGGITDSISALVTGWYSVTISDSNGCTNNDSVFVAIKYPEGVDALNSSYMQVYPNPVWDRIYLKFDNEFSENVEVRLLGGLGQTIRMWQLNGKTGENKFELNVNGLAKGIYLLYVEKEGSTFHHRIIIE